MKTTKALALLIVSVLCIQWTFAQQSTTGPVPPQTAGMGSLKVTASQITIPGVPSYLWYRGCGPTALGMVVGFWDGKGYPDLVPGSSSSQTSLVDSVIASTGHYEDYSLPLDSSPNLLPDKSTLGGAHPSNSIADFMNTSWSSRGNYYGWSWYSDVTRAFNDYVAFANAGYVASSTNYYGSSAWSTYKDEIDRGKPVVLLVDSDGNGVSDHFVTGIGYDQSDTTYGAYNTWDKSIHWYKWGPMLSGQGWGIYGFTTFQLSNPVTPPSPPLLSSPLNMATSIGLSPTLTWNASSGATAYGLQVSTESGFGTTVYKQDGLTSTSQTVVGLSSNTTYYWRVNATSAGGTSDWSEAWSFTTETVLPGFWASMNGPTSGQVMSVSIDHRGTILAGTLNSGLYRSTNAGASWTSVDTNKFQSLLIGNGGVAVGGTDGAGILRSTDGGSSWNSSNTGLSGVTFPGLGIDRSGNLYSGEWQGGVFRSTDNGLSWSLLTTFSGSPVYAFAFKDGGEVFAATYGGGIKHSTDNGSTWSAANNGLTNLYVQSVIIDTAGRVVAGTDAGVFRSTNNGGSWNKISLTWTSQVHDVVVSGHGDIYAGTYNGAYISTDDGNSWSLSNSGLTNTDIGPVTIGLDNHLYIGTWGGGLFGSADPVESAQVAGEYSADGGTVGLWHLNETESALIGDASGNGSHGISTSTSSVKGRFSQARRFTGPNGRIEIPHSPSMNWTSTKRLTFEAWVYPTTYQHQVICFKGTTTASPYPTEWAVVIESDKTVRFKVNADPSNSVYSYLISTREIALNVWTHVACVWDGNAGIMKIYLNGVLAGSSSAIGSMVSISDQPVTLGFVGDGPFTGTMDEVRISNIGRSPEEFMLQLPPTNLVATVGTNSVNLSWVNGGGGAGLLRYRIYRGTDSTNVALLDSTVGTSYVDASAPPGVRQFYRVGAVDLIGFEGVKSFSANAIVPTSSLVAYYPFSGNARDSSGKGRHGTVYGATLTEDRFGTANSAYAFDGVTNYIKASGADLPSTARTVSLWFKADSVSNQPGLLGYGGSGVCGTSWHQGLNIKGLGSYIVTSHCNVKELSSPYASPPLGKWYHWVVTTDPTGTRMFVNGVQIDSNSVFFDNTYTLGGDLAFGTLVSWAGLAPFTDENCGNFNGSLDEIRIYDYALNGSQIYALYLLESTPPVPQTVVAASPSDGFVTGADSVIVRWHPVPPPVVRYWVETSPDSSFQFKSVDSTGGDTTCVLRNLQSPRQYWWRVRAFNGWVNGAYSAARSIHVVTLPTQVQLLMPAQGQLVMADSVRTSWQQAQEYVDRYLIEVATDSAFTFKQSDSTLTGTSFLANGLASSQTYWWHVKAHNAAGWGQFSETRKFNVSITGIESEKGIPTEYTLSQNYPNPFNPSTTIRYGLPARCHVSLTVSNTLGQQIATLVQGEEEAGYHEVKFDASGLASGVYFYRLRAGDFLQTRKLLSVK